jgi:hypothetical protein
MSQVRRGRLLPTRHHPGSAVSARGSHHQAAWKAGIPGLVAGASHLRFRAETRATGVSHYADGCEESDCARRWLLPPQPMRLGVPLCVPRADQCQQRPIDSMPSIGSSGALAAPQRPVLGTARPLTSFATAASRCAGRRPTTLSLPKKGRLPKNGPSTASRRLETAQKLAVGARLTAEDAGPRVWLIT